jgi:hypothetical protein
MGIIMESADKSPSEQHNPFWESEQQSVSPPQGQMVDNVAQQPETHFTATVNYPEQINGQFNSASSITTRYDTSEKKKGMIWGQFVKGFFTPIGIMLFLSIYSDASGGEGIMSDSFLGLMLLIAIITIVISFARGNKSYGYGMLISVSIPVLWIVLIYGFVILLMIA